MKNQPLTSRPPASSSLLRITSNPSLPMSTNHWDGMEVQVLDMRISGAPQWSYTPTVRP
jgi:hypothetical protein